MNCHTDCPWVLLYIERWLEAPVQIEDGSVVPRTAGTPREPSASFFPASAETGSWRSGNEAHSAGARHLGPAARVRTATWGRGAQTMQNVV
jgi:hypothetical protein